MLALRCSLHNLLVYRDPGHLAKQAPSQHLFAVPLPLSLSLFLPLTALACLLPRLSLSTTQPKRRTPWRTGRIARRLAVLVTFVAAPLYNL